MSALLRSVYDTRLAAIYPSSEEAYDAAEKLINETKLVESKVDVVAPKDFSFSEKLGGESQEIGRELIYQHVLWGVIGLGAGMVLAALLVAFGPALTQQNPIFTFVALVSPGLFTGLFISALISLRPADDVLTQKVREAALHRRWTVILHLEHPHERDNFNQAVSSTNPIAVV